jgi:hypothetical protein
MGYTDENKIEIRSEKVRSIIGKVPPRITRYGISTIFIICLGLLFGAYFLDYEYVVDAKSIIYQSNDYLIIILRIPERHINRIKPEQKVLINISNKTIDSRLQCKPEMLTISNTGNFYSLILSESCSKYKISIIDTIQADAKIVTDKATFFDRLFHMDKSY